MPINDVRLAVSASAAQTATVQITDDEARTNNEFELRDGTELSILVHGGEVDVRYVGDKEAFDHGCDDEEAVWLGDLP